jgi:prepilin-type processing-associated H-X9-DG protein
MVASSLVLAPGVYGNEITQYAPLNVPSENEKKINFKMTNDDNGAIYDSYDFNAFTNVILQLWALPQNQTNYNSISEMLDDWRVTIRSEPTGEVSGGWNGSFDSQGKLFLNSVGGIIDVTYDGWYAEQQNPNQNDMFVTVSVPDSLLDSNSNGWSMADSNDYTIVLSDNVETNMGIASAGDGLNYWYADGHSYELRRNGARVEIGDMTLHGTNNALYVELEISWDSTIVTTNYLEKSSGETNSAWFALRSWSGLEGTTNILDELTNGCYGAKYRMRSRW